MRFNSSVLDFVRKSKLKKAKKILKKIENGNTNVEYRYIYAEKLARFSKKDQRMVLLAAFHTAWDCII